MLFSGSDDSDIEIIYERYLAKMSNQYSPIALFVYNRPDHVRQTVDALRKNHLAGESELFIFSDGPRDRKAQEAVSEVREYIKTASGFRRVTIIERDRNLGCAQSIATGVTKLIAQYGKAIVLEDDIAVSPYFLNFMNDGLSVYENEEQVISICGYMYPIEIKHEDTVFLRVSDGWGWATWKRGWDLFVADGEELYRVLKARKLLKKFNLDGSFNYSKMLKEQIKNRYDIWDICWYASALLNGKLSLYPRKSLTVNIGIDGSGTNCGAVDDYKTELVNERISVNKIPILENKDAMREIGFLLKRQMLSNIIKRPLWHFRRIRDTISR